ncbi:MAG: gliding motility-associated C-terminal domain-containing protein, partial [Chitinophagaceae bacterium]
TQSATASTGAPAPTCNATGVNDDVWYSFVATGAVHTLTLTNITGTSTGMSMALYSGAACGSLTNLQCLGGNTLNVGGLTAGQTYFVRIYTTTATAGLYGSFTFCVGTPPPPPANDEPCNAIALNVAENGTCTFQQFTTASATGTSGVPAPGCANYAGGDVWFKAVVPCSGSIIIDAQTGVITDGGMAIYRGTCGNLSLIVCDDDGSANGLMPRISRTGLTPGETLWIRFWEYGNDNNGTFSLCAQAPPPAPPAATCQTAQSFCTSTTPNTIPNITGQPSTAGGGIYGCLTTIPNPTYYYLQIQNSGSIQITISQTSTAGVGVDVDFVVWGPFNSLNTTCTAISAANIVDCSYSTAGIEVVDIPNAVAGQYYLFLVTNFSDQPGTITYQQTGGTGSSNCAIVCTLAATNNGPVCAGAPINLGASTVTGAVYQWTGPNCFNSTLQNPTVVSAPTTPGQYVYTVTATTPSGQTCQDTTIVTVSPKPVLAADTSFKICSGSTANLTTIYTTTGLSSAWTLGGVTVANPAAVNVTGRYRLIAANTTGCSDTAFVNLTVDTVRSQVTTQQIVCTQTATITITNLSGIAPFQYSISSNPGVFQTSNQFVAAGGTYTITTRDSLGCTGTTQATITIVPELTVNAGQDVSIVSGDRAQLLATASGPTTSILWTPSTGLNATNIFNPIANPAATTTYTVAVTNSLGCQAQDDVVVTVIPYCIKVNNAFTPNGDGINDLWQVYDSYDCLRNVTVNVFNRYGKKVYENKDYRKFWDGRFENKPLPDGTYYAVVDFTLITGRKISVKTDLTILR